MVVLGCWRDVELASGLTGVPAHRRDIESAAELTALLTRPCSLAGHKLAAGRMTVLALLARWFNEESAVRWMAVLARWVDNESAAGLTVVLGCWRDFESASGLTAVLAHRRDI